MKVTLCAKAVPFGRFCDAGIIATSAAPTHATISGMFGRRLDPARSRLRHPHRRGRQLVPRPVPDHLVAVGLLRATSRRARAPSCSPRSARCSSSSRSCCTSSATRSWRSATASRSQGIDLWLFGGVAKLGRDTDSAGVEFRVAVAGPLVTLVIAARLLRARRARSRARSEVVESSRFDDTDRRARPLAVLGYLTSINVIVLLFNLIPGFPLDGGRIARAIAWKITGDRNRATRFAARARARLRRLGDGRRRHLHADRVGQRRRRHLARLHRLLPRAGGGLARSAGRLRRPHRGHARVRRDGRRARGGPRRACRSTRPSTSSSCATAGPGSRWSTAPGGSSGVVTQRGGRRACRSASAEPARSRR